MPDRTHRLHRPLRRRPTLREKLPGARGGVREEVHGTEAAGSVDALSDLDEPALLDIDLESVGLRHRAKLGQAGLDESELLENEIAVCHAVRLRYRSRIGLRSKY